jgi:hypothetical protein
MVNRIFVGYDPREVDAYRVCIASLLAHARGPISIEPVNMRLGYVGPLYRRPWTRDNRGVLYDTISCAPMSTEFSLARFFVPQVARSGWALYVDCDFLFRAPVEDLFALADDSYAVQVVKHDHAGREVTKMDAQPQTRYTRKNWSSLVLWNCNDPVHRYVWPNDRKGLALHQFAWLPDTDIGALPAEWNHLVGCNAPNPDAKAVHFTLGIPSMIGYEKCEHADEWRRYATHG